MRRGIDFIIALTVCAFLAFGGQSQLSAETSQQVGVTAAVRGNVTLDRASSAIFGRQVRGGEPVFPGGIITSGEKSGVQIMLFSESVVSIWPNCNVKIDRAIYDPDKSLTKFLKETAEKA